MAVASYIERYRYARYSLFRWRYELGVVEKVALALGMAAFTGVTAQLWMPHPFTPVPITGQVFAVLLAGVLLGRWYGGLSLVIYTGLGIAGVPWFFGFNSGWGYIGSITGGYKVAFIIVPFVIGWLLERHVGMRRFLPLLLIMMTGVGIIYLFGVIWYSLAAGAGLMKSVLDAAVYFIPVDLAKAVAVAAIAYSVLPKAAYGGEVDAARYRGRRF